MSIRGLSAIIALLSWFWDQLRLIFAHLGPHNGDQHVIFSKSNSTFDQMCDEFGPGLGSKAELTCDQNRIKSRTSDLEYYRQGFGSGPDLAGDVHRTSYAWSYTWHVYVHTAACVYVTVSRCVRSWRLGGHLAPGKNISRFGKTLCCGGWVGANPPRNRSARSLRLGVWLELTPQPKTFSEY